MDSDDIREQLNDLMHLDVDAVRAYEEAIDRVDEAPVREQLAGYMRDHQRHVDQLRLMVSGLGGEPEEARPDFKGMLIEGMTKLRSAISDEQALKAMRQNEIVTNRAYSEATTWDVPDDVHEVLVQGYRDEQTHLAYIEDRLSVTAGSTGYER